ncbi:MAG TPA: nucleotidyltransferase family protein [Candidatus Acidoferrales bacterium]|nr:nucleotidyltransferase family protein [Candidatus Acidoferrales bacterium]
MKEARSARHVTETLRPELKFVLCCGRTLIEPAAKERFHLLVLSDLNWPEVVAFAAWHRLLPIVHETIAGMGQDLISPGHLNMLRETAASSTANGMALLRELLRLNKFFDAAQILAIPYKGPLLAWVAYGSFIRREYSDLDFVVQHKFISETVAVLKSAGYRPQFDLQEVHSGQDGIAPGQFSFLLHPQEILAEFHTERTLRYFPTPIDFQELTKRLMTVEIGEQCVHTFSIEDTLVMLCVHGAKHFWERLGWVLDIAKLITVREVDWTFLLRIAAKMESTRVLLLGLCLAHDLFDAPLPRQLLEEICRDRTVQELAQKVCEQYAGASDLSAGVWSRAVFRFQSRDGLRKGFRHTLRLALSPTESDRQTVRLPRLLAPLYTIVRPWRLLREYGLGSNRRRKTDHSHGGPAS